MAERIWCVRSGCGREVSKDLACDGGGSGFELVKREGVL